MFLQNSANWFPSAAVSSRRRTESSKIYARIHKTKRQTQINLSPISNLQDNSSPFTSTSFLYNGIFLSSTSNSTSLQLSIPLHGPAKTAVSEHFSFLGNVFTRAHHVLQNKLIISYQLPTSEAPKSIFEASAENGLNKHHKCAASKRTKGAWETYHVISWLLHERAEFIKQN
jgi:hypothetical protein